MGISNQRSAVIAEWVLTERQLVACLITRAPGRNRTCDLRYRKPALYPLSYGGDSGAGYQRMP